MWWQQTLLGDDSVVGELSDRKREKSQELMKIMEQFGADGPTKPKDALAFFKDIEYKAVGGQQLMARCFFCEYGPIASTGSTRLVAHLGACPACPPLVKEPIKQIILHQSKKRKAKSEAVVLATEEAQQELLAEKKTKKDLRQQGLHEGFQSAEAIIADKAIAHFFYANGIAFRPADPSAGSFYTEMIKAIKAAPTGYIPPNYNRLAGPLLDSCHKNMLDKIEARDPDKVQAKKFGVTYCQDGWDSVDHLPLINSCYITAGNGGVYHRSVDTSGKTKTAEYIASLMISDIYEIGCTSVVFIVTDTCAVMQKAWTFVLDEFPCWISAAPCVPHVASLLMKDIGKLKEVDELIKDEALLVSWFSNHQKPLAILRSKVRESISGSCELIKAAATRFGTNTFVGERLLKMKTWLQQTIVDPEYVAQNYKDLPDAVEESNCETITRKNKGGSAKKLILSDDTAGGFWESVKTHVNATLPICKFLRRHDSSAPTVGKVYHGWFEVGNTLSKINADYKVTAEEKHAERWDYCDASFFRAAYYVDPEFAGQNYLSCFTPTLAQDGQESWPSDVDCSPERALRERKHRYVR